MPTSKITAILFTLTYVITMRDAYSQSKDIGELYSRRSSMSRFTAVYSITERFRDEESLTMHYRYFRDGDNRRLDRILSIEDATNTERFGETQISTESVGIFYSRLSPEGQTVINVVANNEVNVGHFWAIGLGPGVGHYSSITDVNSAWPLTPITDNFQIERRNDQIELSNRGPSAGSIQTIILDARRGNEPIAIIDESTSLNMRVELHCEPHIWSNGTFFPKSVRETVLRDNMPTYQAETIIHSLDFTDIPDSVFSLSGLGIPIGWPVDAQYTGNGFGIWNGNGVTPLESAGEEPEPRNLRLWAIGLVLASAATWIALQIFKLSNRGTREADGCIHQ